MAPRSPKPVASTQQDKRWALARNALKAAKEFRQTPEIHVGGSAVRRQRASMITDGRSRSRRTLLLDPIEGCLRYTNAEW